MVFYHIPLGEALKELSEGFIGGSPSAPGLLVHMIALFIGVVLCAYALLKIMRCASGISRNANLLVLACVLITSIFLFDIFEHFDFAPGADFWHHIHIFSSVAAFYFLYRFAVTVDSLVQIDWKRVYAELLLISLIALPFSYYEVWLEGNYPFVLIAVYSLLVITTLVSLYLLLEIVRHTKDIGNSFSLKHFSISMIPLVSISLLFLVASVVFVEYVQDLVSEQFYTAPVMLALIASQFFSLMTATSLLAFAYGAEKIYNFYAPIRAFVESRKKNVSKGRVRVS